MNLYYFLNAVVEFLDRDEEGQTLAEYALILVLISIAAIVIMGTLGTTISTVFSNVNAALGG